MKITTPQDMISIANELNFNIFLCDEELMQWHYVSTSFMRTLKINSESMNENPRFWVSLVDWKGQNPQDFLKDFRDHEESVSFYLPFNIAVKEPVPVHIRLSPLCCFDSGECYRIGSAEIDGENSVYKHEALQSRDNEIEISARIQQTLLTALVSEKHGGFTIEAATIPSKDVDGDFYEFLHLTPEVTDFIIGDVMGKGVPAALLAAAVKTSYYKSLITNRMGKRHLPDLVSISRGMDHLLSRELLELEKFLTLYFCRLDRDKSRLSFIDAGHTSFIYMDAADESCWNVKGANMPMGFIESQEYRAFHLPINKGDQFLFYSDGISEVTNSEGEMFGSERLRQLVLAFRHLEPDALLKKVFNVAFFFASSAFNDDVTGVVIRADSGKEVPLIQKTFNINHESPPDLEQIRTSFETDLSKRIVEDQNIVRQKLILALMEACSNCIVHGDGIFDLIWRIYRDSVEINLFFSGPDFDWHSSNEPEIDTFQTGGFGTFLISQGTDSTLLMQGAELRKRLFLYKELSDG